MTKIGHNQGPEISGQDFEVKNIDPKTTLGQKIYSYIKEVSDGVFAVIVPKVYIIRGNEKLLQIKPDAYTIFDWDGKNFQVIGIEECIPIGTYKKAA